jgi:glycosyltransferase involved in cell wall biosynthesis
MPKLSVIVIAKNEAHAISDCLKSVAFADEIVVLDSGSTDGTQDICRQFTPLVFETDWPGYGKQKNRALEKATGDWILNLDADERLSEELVREIQGVANASEFVAYSIRFEVSFLGRILRHGDWASSRKMRLVRRGCGRFTDSELHERLVVQGPVGDMMNPIIHNTVDSLHDFISKMNQYSSVAASQRRKRGEKSSLVKAVLHAVWNFCRSYILRFGFLDGREGFLQAFGAALGRFFRYAKLMYPDSRGR